MKTFTGKTQVWLYGRKSIDDLLVMTDDEAVKYVLFSHIDMVNTGWLAIGTACVAVTLDSKEVIHQSELDGLNKKLAEIRVAAQLAENELLFRISKLQALTFNGSEICEA